MKRIFAAVITAAYLLTGCAVQTIEETTTQTTAVSEITTEAEVFEETSEGTTTEATTTEATTEATTEESLEIKIDEEGSYTTCEDVSLYIYTYGKLPENFMTKKEAKKLGFKTCIVPKALEDKLKKVGKNIEIIGVSSVADAMKLV